MMYQYFVTMDEFRRLEVSESFLKKQSDQNSKMLHSMMDENKDLKSKNEKLSELSFKTVQSQLQEDDMGDEQNPIALLKTIARLEKKNRDLKKQAEQSTKEIEMLKIAS